jgi:hypothetical protein
MAINRFLVKNRRVFVIWAVAGSVAYVALLLWFRPWEPGMGVPNDPKRWLIGSLTDFWVFRLPLALLGMSFVAARPRWLAPRGRYQEDQDYPLPSTYNYAAIAVCAALLAASGVVSQFWIDLGAAPATLAVTYFNPIVGYFAVWLGMVIRSLIFGAGNPVIDLIGNGPQYATTWLFLGIFYRLFKEKTKWGKNPIIVLVWWFITYWVWRVAFVGDMLIWLAPVPAVWGLITQFSTQYMLTSSLGSLAGLVASEALIRATGRNRTVD